MEFTSDWFLRPEGEALWQAMLDQVTPTKILEVGSYEGRSACWLIARCPNVSITCVDTWEGGVDLTPEMMRGVEERFDRNTAEALQRSGTAHLIKCKMPSHKALPIFIADERTFDFIYIDGSHTAPNVLTDAVDAFRLLRVGGIMVFDDYVWHMEPDGQQDLLNMPKPAIDAFVNINQRKLKLLHISSQLSLIKTGN